MRLAALAVALVVAGCATPYAKSGLLGGYSDAKIDSNTFRISVQGNGYTTSQKVSLMALMRAAEVTQANGFDWFMIVAGADGGQRGTFTAPGNSYTTGQISPSGQYRAQTTTGPAISMPMFFPESGMTIKGFAGAKPADNPNAYDARDVIRNLGPQLR